MSKSVNFLAQELRSSVGVEFQNTKSMKHKAFTVLTGDDRACRHAGQPALRAALIGKGDRIAIRLATDRDDPARRILADA